MVGNQVQVEEDNKEEAQQRQQWQQLKQQTLPQAQLNIVVT